MFAGDAATLRESDLTHVRKGNATTLAGNLLRRSLSSNGHVLSASSASLAHVGADTDAVKRIEVNAMNWKAMAMKI